LGLSEAASTTDASAVLKGSFVPQCGRWAFFDMCLQTAPKRTLLRERAVRLLLAFFLPSVKWWKVSGYLLSVFVFATEQSHCSESF